MATPEKNIPLLHAAAFHFSKITRKVTEIAEYFEVSEKTIRRYKAHENWDIALNAFGYTGSRNFDREKPRDAARDNPKYKIAQNLYAKMVNDNEVPKRNRVAALSSEINVPKQTLYKWIRRKDF